MIRAKLIAALMLIIIGLIVVLQNTQPVETKFLFVSVTMPIAALLALTMLIGIAVGILVALGLCKKPNKKAPTTNEPDHQRLQHRPKNHRLAAQFSQRSRYRDFSETKKGPFSPRGMRWPFLQVRNEGIGASPGRDKHEDKKKNKGGAPFRRAPPSF